MRKAAYMTVRPTTGHQGLYVDNVIRKQAWLEKHPNWTVVYNTGKLQHEAREGDEGAPITAMDLGTLMDHLEGIDKAADHQD
jgi:hypothetical protein